MFHLIPLYFSMLLDHSLNRAQFGSCYSFSCVLTTQQIISNCHIMNKNNHNVDHEIISLSDLQGNYHNNINPYDYHHVSLDFIIFFTVVGPLPEQGIIWQLLFFSQFIYHSTNHLMLSHYE